MRYFAMSMVLVLFAVLHAETQETKKKDEGKDKIEPKEVSEFLGKTYELWRADLKNTDPSKREAAMQAVLRFGLTKATDAIPEIIADLSRHGKTVKGATIKLDMSVRVNGIMALNTYFLHSAKGKKAPDASLVKDAIPIYKSALKDDQIIVKERAVQGVAYLGPAARDLLDDVIPLARHTSTWELRKEAVPVMVMLAANENAVGNSKAIIALKYLAQPLNENSYVVRSLAVKGLGLIGQDTCIVEIRKALNEDPAKEVRLMAVEAMAVGPREKGMLDLKRTWESDGQPKEVRIAAIQFYGAAGKEKAFQELRKLLEHEDKEYRMQALNTIGQMHSLIKTNPKDLTMKKLEERAGIEKDPTINIWTHFTIMSALNDINNKHMTPVVERVGHKEKQVRMQALRIISMTGPKGKPFALKAVMDLVDDADPEIAHNAIETLAHIQAVEAIPMLNKLKNNENARFELREAAENAIDHINLLIAKEKAEKEKKTTDKK